MPRKTINLKGPKWVRKSLKTCKQLYSQWKAIGKIPNNIFHCQLKTEKKLLRKRYEHAIDRKRLYEQLMSNPSTKLFYQLIKRKRSTVGRTQCIKVGDRECFAPDEQCGLFAQYYEDLSVPKQSVYDDTYLNLACVQLDRN